MCEWDIVTYKFADVVFNNLPLQTLGSTEPGKIDIRYVSSFRIYEYTLYKLFVNEIEKKTIMFNFVITKH